MLFDKKEVEKMTANDFFAGIQLKSCAGFLDQFRLNSLKR